MKNILKVFFRDINRLRKNIIALIIVFGVMILPALYAWFNIAANWDPYSNTAGLKIAVVNNDKGTTVSDELDIDCGKQVIDSIKQNKKIGWEFVTTKEAVAGVNSNKYYAALVIPESFSGDLTSFITGKIEKPQIDYYVNEKINAIAPKITDKVVETIRTSIDQSFVDTIANTTATLLDVSGDEISKSKNELLDELTTSFDTVLTDLDDYKKAIAAFDGTLDTMQNLITQNKNLIPSIDTSLDDSKNVGTSAKTALSAVQDCSSQITASLGDIITSADTLYQNVDSELASAFSLVESDADAAASRMDSASSDVSRIINMNNQLKDAISNLGSEVGIDVSKLTGKIDELNTTQQSLVDEINSGAAGVREAGAFPADTNSSVNDLVNSAKTSFTALQKEYNDNTKAALDNAVNSMTKTLDDVTSLVTSVGDTLPQIEAAFDTSGSAFTSMKTALDSTNSIIDSCKDKITSMQDKIAELKKDNTVTDFIDTVLSDPEALGEYLSSPVTINTESIYPIENYGSAMAPFYTTLAIWVGGIVLIAILKTEVTEDDDIKNLRPHHCYLGRYLLFMCIGIVQAVIIGLGDLFFLQIQCLHPVRFMLVCCLSSFIFTLFIYTLTVSFGEIGKALAVIFLVIQLAGSGGTFPVEVLPDFFQKVYPFLPFSYSINAMRETVAGMYGHFYILDLLKMAAYIPVSLLLGLVLRKPLLNLSHFFKKRLEDSHLI